jgi:hypothetical protein
MRKIIKNVVIFLALALIGIGIYWFLVRPNAYKYDNSYKSLIGINLPASSTVLRNEDGHGGFHGDGESYLEIQLTKDGVEKFISDAKETQRWFTFPLPEDVKIILYGGDYGGTSYHIDEISKTIPKDIKNGIYFFRDRFAENYPEEKDKSIYSRGAYNVTISILNFDTNKLYIYELDT